MSTLQEHNFDLGPSWGRWPIDIPHCNSYRPGFGIDAQYLQSQAVSLLSRYISEHRESSKTEAPPMWLEDIYAYCMENKSDDAIDLLFAHMDGMLYNGEINQCNDLLRTIDLKRLNVDLLIGLLSITLPARHSLSFREKLVTNIASRLESLAPGRVERLLNGLR